MKGTLVAFGKLKTPGVRETVDYYLRNLKPWWPIEEVELKHTSRDVQSSADRLLVQREEAETFRKLIQSKKSAGRTRLILLDETGRGFGTLEWAKKFETYRSDGTTSLFIGVGSAYGWHADLKREADVLWSFGRETLSHEIARSVLAEQLYRIYAVLNRHPYHNEGE
ncbi:MAG: 23S rRNA (pseudouridine(1915)-N(3))-methyltransferase RlmH [Proteobacteria bacterium]|nr:MAG: 23S rRNA (pseudouridine(1915)-N(3))-methyltransferase RlmH [Pseudomonadota bacterium]